MNASGPSDDLSEQDEAKLAQPADGSALDDKGKTVSTATSSGKNGSDSAAALEAAQERKVSQKQTQKSGLAALLQFIAEALIELKRITWPERQQVIKETISVIVLVTIITACVLAFDYGIAKAVFEPLDKLARHLGGGIGVHH
ncbi:MAG: preprotein translocase subunit SecE [Candidatus Obscuribacterales bacterium]|nr:preprotein translocase subunit SecE [Candidatus Obscuribacterales bacterium]